MFGTSLSVFGWVATFVVFAVPFVVRSWVMTGVCAIVLSMIGAVFVLVLQLPVSPLIIWSAIAGLVLRSVTLFLRKATRARLAAKGLSENAKVAGRKLVLIGVFAGYPVWMQIALQTIPA